MKLRTFGAALVIGSTMTIGAAIAPAVVTGCTPAQSAVLGKIEQTVLDDVLAGKLDTEIEIDVANILGLTSDGGPTVSSIVVAVVVDVTQFLIDAGFIPSRVLAQTKALHDREASHLSTLKNSGGN